MNRKENEVAYSVGELVDMARALSEGDFERQFQAAFQGELGQLASYLEAVRQTLRSISEAASSSFYVIPQAANGVAEIYQHAENGVNSILDVVDGMSADQEEAAALLAAHNELKTVDVRKLQEITDKTRRSLMSLIGYLSFQDVLRQRVEKVQGLIENLEKRSLELLVKFGVKTNEQDIKEGKGEGVLRDQVKELSGEIGLDQALVDQLLADLK
jgi:methyl-accepting chemotaxis protein